MNTLYGDVWTHNGTGWLLRAPTAGDDHRRRLLRAWKRGDIVTDKRTHERRPMSYRDVLEEVREHGITEVECAP